MEFEIINDVLINSTDKNIFDKGSKYYEDGYVKKIKYTNRNKILCSNKILSNDDSKRYKININNKQVLHSLIYEN